jgi:hypothetical protein
MREADIYMASRIMHICIGEILCSKFHLDRNRFLLGNIAPDAYISREYKSVSHFALNTPNDETKHYLDTRAFLEKYKESIDDDFFLGYYCHLLSDEIFQGSIFNKYVKPYEREEQGLILSKCYQDLGILNGILIRNYNIENNFSFSDNFQMNEICKNSFKNLFASLLNDFMFEDLVETGSLQVYKYDDIVSFLNEAVDVCTSKLNRILLRRAK